MLHWGSAHLTSPTMYGVVFNNRCFMLACHFNVGPINAKGSVFNTSDNLDVERFCYCCHVQNHLFHRCVSYYLDQSAD